MVTTLERPVYLTGVTISTSLDQFLQERVRKGDKDAPIARAFLDARVDYHDEDAHDYYGLSLIDDKARITYTTRKKLNHAMNTIAVDSYFQEGVTWRIQAKPATVAQRVTELPADEYGRGYDVFTHAATAYLTIDEDKLTQIHVVSGTQITHHYHEDNHCQCGGYLGDLQSSCMRYSRCQDRFGIYEDHAQMAILLCGTCGGLRARALLWTDTNEQRWIDRIYANDLDTALLKLWAAQEGYGELWDASCHSAGVNIQVTCEYTEYDYAPYLDSLYYWCRTCGELRTSHCPSHYSTELHDHENGYLDAEDETEYCPHCDTELDGDGDCQNYTACDGCGTTYCSRDEDGCPNHCPTCEGCDTIYSSFSVPQCDCVPCDECNERASLYTWRTKQGECPNCGHEQFDDMAPRPVTTQWNTGFYYAGMHQVACQQCVPCLQCGHTRSYDPAYHTPGYITYCLSCGQVHEVVALATSLPDIVRPMPQGTRRRERRVLRHLIDTQIQQYQMGRDWNTGETYMFYRDLYSRPVMLFATSEEGR